MAVFSTLLRSVARNVNLTKNGIATVSKVNSNNSSNLLQIVRQMSDHGPRTMAIKPSKWQWTKFKDLVHFYVMLGVIPSTLVIMYINLFIGPAKLAEIPEGYVPEAYEYNAHPITRWLAKHVSRSYQQEYEVMCHHIHEEEYKQKLRRAEKNVLEKMEQNMDTQAYYYTPITSRYEKMVREKQEITKETAGFN